MLGSAKTNWPLLTLTSWVKGTSSFWKDYLGLHKHYLGRSAQILPRSAQGHKRIANPRHRTSCLHLPSWVHLLATGLSSLFDLIMISVLLGHSLSIKTSKLKKTNPSTINETPHPQERIAVLQVGSIPFPFYRTNSNNLQASKCDVIMIGIGIGPKSGGHWECPHPIWTSQISRHVSYHFISNHNFARILVSTVHWSLRPNVHVKGQFRIL